MKNITNLVIKFMMVLVVLAVLIPVYGKSTWTQTIITALVLTLISYVVGDLWILPKFGNIAALIGDFVLNALIVWAMEQALPQFNLTTTGIWIIAVALTVAEWLFHYYLLKTHAPGKKVKTD